MARIGINGFGRIGRTFFRHYLECREPGYEVTAIKDIVPLEHLAYLLKYDTTYGPLRKQVRVDKEKQLLIVDGKKIHYFKHAAALDVPWKDHHIRVLIGSTDHDLQHEGEARKLAKDHELRILFTTRRSWCDANLIYRVNHDTYEPSRHFLLTAGSCTGNAIVPMIKIFEEKYGIREGSLISIHCALTDQRVVDTYQHKNPALGRNAKDSIIMIPTRIADSVTDVFPSLKGRLTSVSYRIPTTIITMINASLSLKTESSVEDVNATVKEAASHAFRGIVLYDDVDDSFGIQKASIDYLKNGHSTIYMANQTTMAGDSFVNFSVAHDNEWGYVKRLHDVLSHVLARQQERSF